MANEPITGLPYQDANTLQTDVLQNEQLNYFAAWIGTVVQTLGDTAPPGSPVNGHCYIIGTSATGAWAGKDEYLTVYRDGWQFYAPKEGAHVSNLDDGKLYVYMAGAWAEYTIPASATVKQAQVMLSDMTTALTTGTGKALWIAPEDGSITDVWIGVGTVSSSGAVTVDLNKNGTSVLTTQPSIDASENTSLTGTAAVIGTAAFSKGDRFTFDIDAAGTGAKALMATVEYEPS